MTNLTYAIEYIKDEIEDLKYLILNEESKNLVVKIEIEKLKLDEINEAICDILYGECDTDDLLNIEYEETQVIVELSKSIFEQIEENDYWCASYDADVSEVLTNYYANVL